jgi:hypothetical protein
MAKHKKSKGGSGSAVASAAAAAPGAQKELDAATAVFARGDYARARVMLEAKANDASLSEGAKEEARSLIAATRIEKGTLMVGLACIALFVLVVIVTAILQP